MSENFLNSLALVRSRFLWRLMVQVALVFVVPFYLLVFKPTESELVTGPVLADSAQQGAVIMVAWLGFVLVCRALFYDLPALYAGLVAGALWIFFGDMLVAPFWTGTMGLFVHLYRRRRTLSPILAWYILLFLTAIKAYTDLYAFSDHPIYLILFALLFVGWCLLDVRINAAMRKREAMAVLQAEAEKEKQRVAAMGEPYDIELSRLGALRGLQEPVKSELSNILTAAGHIRHCMLTDPRDEAPGRQFLERYLPIVYTIVTKGQQINTQQSNNGKPTSGDLQLGVLKQLSAAFYQKHQQLLANDQDDLNIEISTLEKLLKTDGFIK